MSPKRIQRKRTKGWRMPEGAMYVGRPTRWGNYLLPTTLDVYDRPLGPERAVELYRLATVRFLDEAPPAITEAWIAPLRGCDLVCWCPIESPVHWLLPVFCHADILLELANR